MTPGGDLGRGNADDPRNIVRDLAALPAGEGTKGERLRAYLELADLDAGDYDDVFTGIWMRGLLIRRNIADGDLAFFSSWCSKETLIETLVKVRKRVRTPPFMQEDSSLNLWTWSGADVCPALFCGLTLAAGPYGNTRIGPITFTRAQDAVRLPGFSNPVSLTVVHKVQETFSHDLPAQKAGRNPSACRRRFSTEPTAPPSHAAAPAAPRRSRPRS